MYSTRKILIKRHRAKIEGAEIKLLDSGVEVGFENYLGSLDDSEDYVQAAKGLATQNDKTIKINKLIKKEGEEFEIELRYLV